MFFISITESIPEYLSYFPCLVFELSKGEILSRKYCHAYSTDVRWAQTWRRHTFLLKIEFYKIVISSQKNFFWAQNFLNTWRYTCSLQKYTLILLRDVKSADILMTRRVTPTTKCHTFLTKEWVVKISISSQQKLVSNQKFSQLHSFMSSFEWMIFHFNQGSGNFSIT